MPKQIGEHSYYYLTSCPIAYPLVAGGLWRKRSFVGAPTSLILYKLDFQHALRYHFLHATKDVVSCSPSSPYPYVQCHRFRHCRARCHCRYHVHQRSASLSAYLMVLCPAYRSLVGAGYFRRTVAFLSATDPSEPSHTLARNGAPLPRVGC